MSCKKTFNSDLLSFDRAKSEILKWIHSLQPLFFSLAIALLINPISIELICLKLCA